MPQCARDAHRWHGHRCLGAAFRGRVKGMEPRVSFITLAVPDPEAAFAFYVEGLGWDPRCTCPTTC